MPESPEKTLVLLDGNSLLYRGFFAMRALTTSAGQPTNALFALTQMLLALVEQHRPDLLFCAWDTPTPTFRHAAYDGYKGTRQETPDDLKAQGALARELVHAFRVPPVEAPGFEADDIIGTLARRGRAAGYRVLIVTGDLDALQLVEPHVQVLTTVKGVSDTILYDEAKVAERYGLRPDQLADYRALKGDPSDNIPGVPGIGEKTASALLQQFGTVENLEGHLDDVAPARVQAAIRGGLDSMRLSKALAIIRRDLDLPGVALPAPADCPPYAPDTEKVRALFETLEFRALLRRIEKFGKTPPAVRDTRLDDPAYDPFAAEDAPPSSPAAAIVCIDTDTPETRTRLTAAAKDAAAIGVVLHAGEGGILDAPLWGIALAFGGGTVFYAPVAPLPASAEAAGLGGLFEEKAPESPTGGAGRIDAAVAALLEDGAIPKVTHDARTAFALLERYGVSLRGLAFDTEIASYLLGAGRRTGFPLQEMAQDYAHRTLPALPEKKERKELPEAARAAREKEFACHASEALLAIRDAQLPRLEAEGLTGVLQEIELPVAPILAQMERCGVRVDVPTFQRMSVELGGQIAALETQIQELAGETFTINSPKQLSAVLFEKLKLPSGKKTTTGYSTDADVLEQLAPDYPIVSLVLQYRELAKLKGTYADAMPALVRADGRIHTSLNQTVAATGRLSSSNPNLQNIPIRTPVGREIRRAFVAPPGWQLLSADYSQIELRIFAHVAEDAQLIEAFASGEDIHRYTAGRIYGIDPEAVTHDMRRAAKTVNYAVLYGISDFALARQLKIPQAEAKALKANYFARFPEIKAWLDNTIAFAREKGYVQTLLGRRRWIPDINARVFQFRQAAERAAANMPIQGSSADIMKLAMIRVAQRLEADRPQTKLLLQVHDELLFECPPDEVETMGARVREAMEKAYPLKVALDVEVKTGVTWADVTPIG